MIKYQKEELDKIVNCLNNNELIILKTDTVYGIMAKTSKNNEISINKFKNSDINKKVSIIFPNIDALLDNIDTLSNDKITLIKEKLPGKYTFIVNLKDEFIKPLGFNRKDFGVRVTSNDYLQNIISITGPLLASSCNITGYKPCRNMKEIEDQFKNTNINVVVDSEAIDIPSTIIDLTSDEIKIIR